MKTRLFVIVFLSIVTNIFGQKDTLYFDAEWHKTIKENASFYRPIPLKKVGDLYQVKEYHSNGTLQMEGFYSDVEIEEFHGKVMWYYNTSQLAQVQNYKKGKRDGEALYYSKNGDLRAKGIYKNDTPFNGYFFEFKPVTSALSYYVNGEITGKQYVGYNDDERLIVLDSMSYKLGKPYQGAKNGHSIPPKTD